MLADIERPLSTDGFQWVFAKNAADHVIGTAPIHLN